MLRCGTINKFWAVFNFTSVWPEESRNDQNRTCVSTGRRVEALRNLCFTLKKFKKRRETKSIFIWPLFWADEAKSRSRTCFSVVLLSCFNQMYKSSKFQVTAGLKPFYTLMLDLCYLRHHTLRLYSWLLLVTLKFVNTLSWYII